MIREQKLPKRIQDLVSKIENQELILAQIKITELDGFSQFEQYLRVQDVNIVLSQNHIKFTPFRVLVNKENQQETILNLPLPEFAKSANDFSFLLNKDGEKEFFETEYRDFVTSEPSEEEPEPEPVLEVMKVESENLEIPSIKYFVNLLDTDKFKIAVEKFIKEFVDKFESQNPNIFKTLG